VPRVVVDALGREIALARAARRIVSLVPSETETVALSGGVERLVGRTDFCEEPRGSIESVASVGGTKKCDVETVIAMAPDLVLANQEENGRSDVERLIAAGLSVHVSFPRSLADGAAYLRSIEVLLEVEIAAARELEALVARGAPEARRRAFVPIWREPWMTFDARAYASDVLSFAGIENVFADRERRYPLAADVGGAEPLPKERTEGKDTRYPRIDLAELRARAPEVVLLPDEPYRFGEADAAAIREVLPAARIDFVSGKDLFWYGARAPSSVARLARRA
jgi:ABC-type Fe3+-hydroxamate transport system substrate-binding protein